MSRARDTADNGRYPPFRKNLLINGSMQITQRGTSFAAVANADYTLDRWQVGKNTSGVVLVDHLTHNGADATLRHYLRLITTGTDVSIAAGDHSEVQQKVEGHDVAHLDFGLSTAKTVTLGFWHANTPIGTYCVAIRNAANNRSYVAEYTQSVASTWEYTEITIPGDTTGTWQRTTSYGLVLSFAQAAGSTFQTTADIWTAGNYLATSNQVNALENINDAVRIGDVQLEVGSVATEFEVRQFSEELASCQRYYEKSYNIDNYPGDSTQVGATMATLNAGGSRPRMTYTFVVPKRSAPTMKYWDRLGTENQVSVDTDGSGSFSDEAPAASTPISQPGTRGANGDFNTTSTGWKVLWHWEAVSEM